VPVLAVLPVLNGLPPARVLAAALVALLLVAHRDVWRYTRTVVTIAHEGGHALVALLTGRRLAGIRLHSDTSGVTVSVGRPRGPGMVCTALAGYAAPSLLGLAAAALVATGQAQVVLWAALALLFATLVYVRTLFGALVVLIFGTLVGLVAWYATAGLRAAFGAALAWFLLFGGLRAVLELAAARRRSAHPPRRARESDAEQLARLTGIHAAAWTVLFALVALAALGAGGWLLLGPELPLR
jgi:hypothetical protein